MDDTPEYVTLGEQLAALKDRSGLPLARIASLAGYGTASAIQRYFSPGYDPKKPNIEVGRRLAKALMNRGSPAIDAEEVLQLFGPDIDVFRELHTVASARREASNRRIPLTNAARLPEPVQVSADRKVEGFVRSWSGQVIVTPVHLISNSLIGLFLPVANLWPKYESGEFVLFKGDSPPNAGDYVILEFNADHDERRPCIVARLRKIVGNDVYLEQHSPEMEFIVPLSSLRYIFPAAETLDLLPAIEFNKDA